MRSRKNKKLCIKLVIDTGFPVFVSWATRPRNQGPQIPATVQFLLLSSLPVAVLLIPPLTFSRSYCERVFRDCRLQTCYVQSPAYPGVYPRGLHCRYHLNTRLPFIKLYIENEEFNIDGQRCENIMTCPMRPISSGEKHCPYDYIKIYDGVNEGSPVIGKA